MSSGPVARSRNRSKRLRKPENLRRLPTCRRPVARGNFRRRQILFPRPSGGPAASSETRPRSLAGRDTRRHVSLRRGAQPTLTRRVPEVRSVARVGSILVYAPAIDPDGLCSSVIMFSASRGPKFQSRFRGAIAAHRAVRGRAGYGDGPCKEGQRMPHVETAHPTSQPGASRQVAHGPVALQDQ